MEDAFARAYLALANDAHIQSTESWAKKKRVEAAAALETANRNLEKSIAWTGGKIEKGTNDGEKKSDALALKLKQKGDLLADDVSRGLQEAGNEIEKFGKKFLPGDERKTGMVRQFFSGWIAHRLNLPGRLTRCRAHRFCRRSV
jgi:hypothetical protein